MADDLVKYRYTSVSSTSINTGLKNSSLNVLNNILTIDVSPQFTKLKIGSGNNKFSLGNYSSTILPEFDSYITYSESLSSSSATPIYVGASVIKRGSQSVSDETSVCRMFKISRSYSAITINKPKTTTTGSWFPSASSSDGYTIGFYFKITYNEDSNALALLSMSNASQRFVIELRKQSSGVFAPYMYSTYGNGDNILTNHPSISKNKWYFFVFSWGYNDSAYAFIGETVSTTHYNLFNSSKSISSMLGSSTFYHIGIGTPVATGSSGTYLTGNSFSNYNFIGYISPIQITIQKFVTNSCSYDPLSTYVTVKPMLICNEVKKIIDGLDVEEYYPNIYNVIPSADGSTTLTGVQRIYSTTFTQYQLAYNEFIFQKNNENEYYKVLVQGAGPGRWGRGYQGSSNTIKPSWCGLNTTDPTDHSNNRQGYYYNNAQSNMTYTVGDGVNGYFCFKYIRQAQSSTTSNSTSGDYAYVEITPMKFTHSNAIDPRYNGDIIKSLKYNNNIVDKAYFNGNLCYLRPVNVELANDDTSQGTLSSGGTSFIDVTVTGSHGTTNTIIVPYGVKGPIFNLYYEDTVRCLSTGSSSSSTISNNVYTIKNNWRIVGNDSGNNRYPIGETSYGT